MAKRNSRGRNNIVPRAGEVTLAEEQQTAQAKLRTAVFNAISEADVVDVVKRIVENAKEGDRVALKYLFDYILGGRVTTAVQNIFYIEGEPKVETVEPTDAPPGTIAKVGVLANRAKNGEPLFRDKDRQRQ